MIAYHPGCDGAVERFKGTVHWYQSHAIPYYFTVCEIVKGACGTYNKQWHKNCVIQNLNILVRKYSEG